MRTPPHVVAYRLVTSALAVLILVWVGVGMAGHGPLGALHQVMAPVSHALHLDRISG
jgi:hypothetical protein